MPLIQDPPIIGLASGGYINNNGHFGLNLPRFAASHKKRNRSSTSNSDRYGFILILKVRAFSGFHGVCKSV